MAQLLQEARDLRAKADGELASIVAAALWVLGQVIAYLSGIVIPVAIALLLAALLAPAVQRLVQWRVPRGLATAMVLVGGLAALGVLLTFVVRTVVGGVYGGFVDVGVDDEQRQQAAPGLRVRAGARDDE